MTDMLDSYYENKARYFPDIAGICMAVNFVIIDYLTTYGRLKM